VWFVNEKDIRLSHVISSIVGTEDGRRIYLLNIRHLNLVRVDLVLLKAFLEEKKMRGLLITVDRPHQYISHLLQLHGVEQANLIYLDTISSHAADTKGGAIAPEFQNGPFHVETLPDFLMERSPNQASLNIDVSSIDFIIIDNVATLLAYNTMDSVRSFFQRYVEVLKSIHSKGIWTALAVDRDLYPDLFKFIKELSSKMIVVSPDMVVEKVCELHEPAESLVEPASGKTTEMEKDRSGIINGKDVM
jgi:hypothetical protein